MNKIQNADKCVLNAFIALLYKLTSKIEKFIPWRILSILLCMGGIAGLFSTDDSSIIPYAAYEKCMLVLAYLLLLKFICYAIRSIVTPDIWDDIAKNIHKKDN